VNRDNGSVKCSECAIIEFCPYYDSINATDKCPIKNLVLKFLDKDLLLRRFWMGKTQRVRNAVEDLIYSFRSGKISSLSKICRFYNVSEESIRNSLRKLGEQGLIEVYFHGEFIFKEES